MITRFLTRSVLLLAWVISIQAEAVPRLRSTITLSRIAFGSCAIQDQPQPIWKEIATARPQLFLHVGDNIYGDTQDMRVMREKYALLAAMPEYRKLRKSTPIMATWDDHDYGVNDGDATYPMRVQSHSHGGRVLAFDDRAYRRVNREVSSDGFVRRDYYLVDLSTGDAAPLAQGLWVTTRAGKTNIPRLSPDGTVALYQQDGDYIAYDISNGRRSNLTASLPAQFFFEEDQRNSHHARDDDRWLRSEPFQGWTTDSRYAFVSDYRDVWALPLKGGKAMNLTGNGRRDDIAYRRTAFRPADSVLGHDFGGDLADLGQPLYFFAHDRQTGRSGLARHLPGQDGATMLSSEYAELSYQKAERADVYLVARRTSADAPRHAMVDAQWRAALEILDEATLGRSPGSPRNVYLTRAAPNGKTYHGVLIPPYGYVPGKTYPTIVSIYEELDLSPHSSTVGEFNETYLRHGYALLMPSIQPRYNEAGVAAVESVTAAVEAAVATGIADRDRLGLTGYSMGAYNTLIVVSHTDLFKAAISRAGISNLWSAYGGMHDDNLRFRGQESSQNYLAGPWWDHWQAFLDNSPLYRMRSINTPLLLVHGDQDRATPFANIVELFVSLHRLGTKPVVLLQYAGEGHISYNDDSSVRMLQFFDHFLKGAPAPAWWSEGISRPQGQVAMP